MDQENKEEILALLHELLANLKDPDIENKIRELVLWEAKLTKEISSQQQIDPGDILQAIDKIVSWLKDLIMRRKQYRF